MPNKSLFQFYLDEIQTQFPAVDWMTSGGFHIDEAALLAFRHRLRDEIAGLLDQINSAEGWRPNVDSPIEMEQFLLHLGVTPSLTPASKKAKIAKEDLLDYAYRASPDARRLIELCLDIRSRKTLLSDFLQLALDQAGYYHPTYRLNGTKTGRFASEGADEGGPQGQNWPPALLHIVIPDNPERDELTEGDLSQAEDMIIAYDASDIVAIDAFDKGVDSHRLKACWVFRDWEYRKGLPDQPLLDSITTVCPKCSDLGQSKCTHSERFIAKTSGYAFKYKMGVRKFVKKILPPAGIYLTEAQGREIKDRVVSPPTVKWQEGIERDLRRSRWLANPLGRKREFYGRLDSTGDLLREALSWQAQSTVGVIAGRAIVRLEKSLRRISGGARLVTQRHDSVLASHRRADRALVYEAIKEAFHSPINCHGRTLNIPVELKSGPSWGDLH